MFAACMLREHAPLIVVTTIFSILIYLVFRDLRSVRAGLEALAAQCLSDAPPSLPPAAHSTPEASLPALKATPEPPTAQPTVAPAAQPATKSSGKRA